MANQWKMTALSAIHAAYERALSDGKAGDEMVSAIDAAYPFGERARWPYKCWLVVRKEFLITKGLSFQKGARLRNVPAEKASAAGQLSLF